MVFMQAYITIQYRESLSCVLWWSAEANIKLFLENYEDFLDIYAPVSNGD